MGILARLTKEPRHPEAERVPWTARTLAGVAVNEDNALMSSTVWAATRYISQSVAHMPWHVMKEIPGGGEVASSHPVDKILYVRASPEWSPFQFRETLIHWALRWGNGYAEIEPDQIGRPIALHPVHPDRVEVCRATEDSYDSYGDLVREGELYYEINNGTNGTVYLSARRMFHIRGFGEGPVGVNVMHYAAQSIGWARAAQLFGASFFGNGMNVGGVVTNKVALSPEALKIQKAAFEGLYRGVRNAHKTVHLDQDATFTPIASKMSDSQFIEVNQHLVEEQCRWFGIPPHKAGHLLRSTNNNIEHQSIEVVQDALLPWVKRCEDEADFKLFGQNRRGFYTKINMMSLLRGDFKSQAEGFKIYREMGVVNGDEIRERIDMNPQPGGAGKKYTMNSAYTTLERVGEQPTEPPSPEPAKPGPGGTGADDAAGVAALVAAGIPVDGELHADAA